MTILDKPGLNVYRYQNALEDWIKNHEGLVVFRPMIPTPKKKSKDTVPRKPSAYGSVHGWIKKRLPSLGLVVTQRVPSNTPRRGTRAIPYRVIATPAPQFELFLRSYLETRRLPEVPDQVSYGVAIENDPWRVFMVRRNPNHPTPAMRELYQLPMKYWTKGEKDPLFPHAGAAAEAAVAEMSGGSVKLRAFDRLTDCTLKQIWANGKYTEHIAFAGPVKKAATAGRRRSRFGGTFLKRDQIEAASDMEPLSKEWLLRLSARSMHPPE
jgi:hypothetical protein